MMQARSLPAVSSSVHWVKIDELILWLSDYALSVINMQDTRNRRNIFRKEIDSLS